MKARKQRAKLPAKADVRVGSEWIRNLPEVGDAFTNEQSRIDAARERHERAKEELARNWSLLCDAEDALTEKARASGLWSSQEIAAAFARATDQADERDRQYAKQGRAIL